MDIQALLCMDLSYSSKDLCALLYFILVGIIQLLTGE